MFGRRFVLRRFAILVKKKKNKQTKILLFELLYLNPCFNTDMMKQHKVYSIIVFSKTWK